VLTELNDLAARVSKHLADLSDAEQGVVFANEDTFRLDHVRLENELAHFADGMRTLKQDLFKTSEEMFHSDEATQLTSRK
jgi:hypothetical protein